MSLPLPRWAQDATPIAYVPVDCPLCGCSVRVPVIREFLHLFRRVSALAGTRFSDDLPMFADRCPRGHVVTVPLGRVTAVA